jgi:sarcosine oxidase subunit gamma
MAEPARTSPLAGTASEAVPGPEPVAITTLPFRGKLVLRGAPAIGEAAAGVLGVALPPLMRSARGGQLEIFGLGPDEWLLLTGPGAEDALADELRAALGDRHHAVVVVSDRMTGIGVRGARAVDVLATGCPLDLHPKVFGPGAVTRTLLGKAAVVLSRPDDAAAYELWVNGSFAPYVWLFLRNAALEFDVTPAA